MNVSITVRHCGETTTLRAEAGTPLAPLLREAGLLTPALRRRQSAASASSSPPPNPCAEERALLGDAALASGLRLACYTRAAEGLDIALPQAGALRVLTRFAQSDYPVPAHRGAPPLRHARAVPRRPAQRPATLIDACGAKGHAPRPRPARRPARLHTQRPLQRRVRRRARQRVRLRPHAWGNPRRLYGLG